jgi:hypothetical protein
MPSGALSDKTGEAVSKSAAGRNIAIAWHKNVGEQQTQIGSLERCESLLAIASGHHAVSGPFERQTDCHLHSRVVIDDQYFRQVPSPDATQPTSLADLVPNSMGPARPSKFVGHRGAAKNRFVGCPICMIAGRQPISVDSERFDSNGIDVASVCPDRGVTSPFESL